MMHLVEYNPIDDGNMVREISDDEDAYTYLPDAMIVLMNLGSFRSKSYRMQR